MNVKAKVILPLMTLAAAAILAACGGNAAPPTLAPTRTPTAIFSGGYCTTAPNIAEQLKSLGMIETNFSYQNSSPKNLEELIRLGDGIVMFLKLPAGIETMLSPGTKSVEVLASQGLSLGGGYFVTVSHGIRDSIAQVPNSDNSYSVTISPNKVLLVYVNDKKEPVAVPVQNITALPNRDMALVYLPSQDKESIVAFRPSSTLKHGEKLYNVTSEGGPIIRQGEVIDTSITANAEDNPFTYSSQILTSISGENGDSGSPVFDVFGNLVGVASVGSTWNGKPSMTLASIDSLASLLAAQKQQLIACTPAK